MSNPLDMDTVKLSYISKMVENLKRQNKSLPVPNIDPDVTFEYVIGSLFPKAYQNMKEAMTQYYIQGYNQGKLEPQYRCPCEEKNDN